MKYNPITGKLEETESLEPQSYTHSSVLFPENAYSQEKVTVSNDLTGETLEITPDKIPDAIAAGYKYKSPEEVVESELEDKYGNRPYAATAVGALSGATLGISDLVASQVGYDELFRELKKRNAAANIFGEIGSAVAPIIYSAGTSLLASGGKAALKGAGKIAAKEGVEGAESMAFQGFDEAVGGIKGVFTEGAEQAAKEGFKEAAEQTGFGFIKEIIPEKSIAQKISESAVKATGYLPNVAADRLSTKIADKMFKAGLGNTVAKGIIEGGAVGAGQSLSDLSLTEAEITPDVIAESLISNVGMGALLGGGISAGFYGLGKSGGALKRAVIGTGKGEKNAFGQAVDNAFGDTTTQKANADELRKILSDYGVPPEKQSSFIMLADEKAGAGLVELAKAKSIGGHLEYKRQQAVFDALDEQGKKVFDGLENVSPLEAAEVIKRTIFQDINSTLQQASDLYDIAGAQVKGVKIKPRMAEEFIDLIKTNPIFRGLKKQERIDLKEAILRLENVEQLNTFISLNKDEASALWRAGQHKKSAFLYQVIEGAEDVRHKAILRSARKVAKNEAEALRITKQISENKAKADKIYAELHERYSDIFGESGTGMYRGRVKILSIADKIEAMDENMLVDKFLNLKRGGLAALNADKVFKEPVQALRKAYLTMLKDEVIVDGRVDLNKLLNLVKTKGLRGKKLTPENAEILLGKTTMVILNNLQKIKDAYPKRFVNFSNSGSAWWNAFGSNVLKQISDLASYHRYYPNSGLIAKTLQATDDALGVKVSSAVNSLTRSAIDQTAPTVYRGAIVIANSMTDKDYEKRLKRVASLVENPDKLEENIEKLTKGFSDDEDVSTQMQSKVMIAAALLSEKLPKSRYQEPFGPQNVYRPSDQELSKFNRYLRAIENPMSILDDMKAGILTPESVEAVSVVYPQIYAMMVNKAHDKLATLKKPLTMQAKIQISTLMGQPVASSMNPDYMKMLQSNTQQQQKQGQPRKVDFDVSGRSASGVSQVLSR
jgi:hypothetical protein